MCLSTALHVRPRFTTATSTGHRNRDLRVAACLAQTFVALFVLGGGGLADAQEPAKQTILAGEEVRQLLVGHTISGDSRQFADHYLVTFNPDGTVLGKSRRTTFKSALSTDTGHWTLEGNEMCDVFQSWPGRCWQTAQGGTDGTYLFIAPGKVYNGEIFTVAP